MECLFKALKGFWLVLCGKGEIVEAGENISGAAVTVKEPAKQVDVKVQSQPAVDTKKIFEAGSVYSLVLLQREGRLVDFLKEDISSYSDEQVGAAVRQIHTSCAKVLNENFGIRHVVDTPEGSAFTVKENFDAELLTFTGDVPSKFPGNGTLQHAGWIASELKLPSRSTDVNTAVIYRAEISF